jgi:hypothetical protein
MTCYDQTSLRCLLYQRLNSQGCIVIARSPSADIPYRLSTTYLLCKALMILSRLKFGNMLVSLSRSQLHRIFHTGFHSRCDFLLCWRPDAIATSHLTDPLAHRGSSARCGRRACCLRGRSRSRCCCSARYSVRSQACRWDSPRDAGVGCRTGIHPGS